MRQWIKRGAAALLAGLLVAVPAAMAADEAPQAAAMPTAKMAAEIAVSAVTVPAGETWELLLVNPWNPLPEDFQVELVSLKNGMQVDKRIYEDLNAMLTDCWAAGLKPVVCSAYRTQATQTRLHNNKIARLRAAGYSKEAAVKEASRWVAVPGTSEHQTGLALDLVSMDYQLLNEKQEETPEQKWFMEHCWEYGFILRYPAEKAEITGIGYEPWHYRYVGKEAAAAIHASGQCLEEYLLTVSAAEVGGTASISISTSGETAQPSPLFLKKNGDG